MEANAISCLDVEQGVCVEVDEIQLACVIRVGAYLTFVFEGLYDGALQLPSLHLSLKSYLHSPLSSHLFVLLWLGRGMKIRAIQAVDLGA